MATAAQITANIENAKQSTGPRTEEGKAASSQNGITNGLYARRDFIRPREGDEYVKLQDGLQAELKPEGILQQTLVDEIRRATWRLRRCGIVEANMVIRLDKGSYIHDPMETIDGHAKVQKSVDRARAQAHRTLHKCTAELRKLQAIRATENAEGGVETGQPAAKQQTAPRTASPIGFTLSGTARNAQCPCGSGQKYKRCCGRTAVPLAKAA